MMSDYETAQECRCPARAAVEIFREALGEVELYNFDQDFGVSVEDRHLIRVALSAPCPCRFLDLAIIERELARILQELADYEASFELRWNADMRAIARWREAHPGNDLVMPDHADLCVWLIEQLERKEKV